jgi:hypothetical protein
MWCIWLSETLKQKVETRMLYIFIHMQLHLKSISHGLSHYCQMYLVQTLCRKVNQKLDKPRSVHGTISIIGLKIQASPSPSVNRLVYHV